MMGWLHLAALLLYGTAAALMWVSFVRSDRRLPPVASAALAAGLAVHTGALALFAARWAELPLVGLGPSLSTLAYLVGLGTLIASTLGHALTVGLVLIPVVVALVGVATAVGVQPAGEAAVFGSVWFVLHVVFAFVAYVGLTLAFGAGLMYLLQFRELKSKHFGAIFRFFPPLDTLDRLGRLGLLAGFPFLTLALLVGWGWTARFQGIATPDNPKLLWVILSWVVFLAALAARLGGGRRGHRGALASVIGFVVVVVCYLLLRVQSTHGGAFL
jgi:HemX protein